MTVMIHKFGECFLRHPEGILTGNLHLGSVLQEKVNIRNSNKSIDLQFNVCLKMAEDLINSGLPQGSLSWFLSSYTYDLDMYSGTISFKQHCGTFTQLTKRDRVLIPVES